MSKLDKYYTIKTLGEESLSEMDFVLYDELFGKKWSNWTKKHPSDFFIDERTYYSDSNIVKIDTIINTLTYLKNKGCNYVALNDHCDHIGYDFEGILIEEAKPELVEDFLKDKEESKQKKLKIQELEQEIQKLK